MERILMGAEFEELVENLGVYKLLKDTPRNNPDRTAEEHEQYSDSPTDTAKSTPKSKRKQSKVPKVGFKHLQYR